jgi:hypothetical protein
MSRPLLMTPSQSSESMLSVQSMPTMAQTVGGVTSQSVSSLISADNVLYPDGSKFTTRHPASAVNLAHTTTTTVPKVQPAESLAETASVSEPVTDNADAPLVDISTDETDSGKGILIEFSSSKSSPDTEEKLLNSPEQVEENEKSLTMTPTVGESSEEVKEDSVAVSTQDVSSAECESEPSSANVTLVVSESETSTTTIEKSPTVEDQTAGKLTSGVTAVRHSSGKDDSASVASCATSQPERETREETEYAQLKFYLHIIYKKLYLLLILIIY